MPWLNLARVIALIAVGTLALALAPAGCEGGWWESGIPEGDRCNPYDSHNECSTGLQCTVSSWQVANQVGTSPIGTPLLALGTGAGMDNTGAYNVLEFCPENYCCPVDSNGALTASANGNCNIGCNGGATSLCGAVGNSTAPYVGVCDFATNGTLPDAGGPTPEAGGPMPEAGGGG